jgi:putative intracellular protease/amidase
MEKRAVHLFVFDTLSDWEPGYAVAAINAPPFIAQPKYCIKTVGLSREPVKTLGGITILPDMTLAELEPAQSAMLILPGSDAWTTGKNLEAIEKAKAFLVAGVPVAAICGAVDGLALAGMLDDKLHTGNAPQELKATGYRGETLYQQNQLAVTDGNLITASGVGALEFAYHIFKKLEIYDTEMLDAWFGLFKTGDPSYFFAIQKLVV